MSALVRELHQSQASLFAKDIRQIQESDAKIRGAHNPLSLTKTSQNANEYQQKRPQPQKIVKKYLLTVSRIKRNMFPRKLKRVLSYFKRCLLQLLCLFGMRRCFNHQKTSQRKRSNDETTATRKSTRASYNANK